ncbi:hypothetical protein [Magnetovibrio blakemorei]|nr:hypothetical protein [Magnetovibrio blakemorei]
MKKVTDLLKASVPVMIGVGLLVLLVKWGNENDIPVLSEIYDVIS